MEHATRDLRVLSLSPVLGGELTLRKKKDITTKINRTAKKKKSVGIIWGVEKAEGKAVAD